MKRKMSKRTLALLAAAMLLFGAGGATATRAALNIQSDYYVAHFYLNHLQVHLLENGKDVCGGKNNLDGSSKITGVLGRGLDSFNESTGLGVAEPGKLYESRIAAKNGNNVDEFVRLTIRKYWVEKEPAADGSLVKAAKMNPEWIHLTYNGSEDGNTGAWAENKAEATDESRTFYYKSVLPANATTADLFNQIRIDGKLAELGKTTTHVEDGKTIFTYEYKYDGYSFRIEADVQAIQTHNINQAIKSQWGVDNVTGTYNSDNGTGSLTVK